LVDFERINYFFGEIVIPRDELIREKHMPIILIQSTFTTTRIPRYFSLIDLELVK